MTYGEVLTLLGQGLFSLVIASTLVLYVLHLLRRAVG